MIPTVCLMRDFSWRAFKDIVRPNKVVLANTLNKNGQLGDLKGSWTELKLRQNRSG